MSDRMSGDRVGEIFAALVECSSERRTAELAELCADNLELRAEVKSLLAASDRAKGFLSASPIGSLLGHNLHTQALLGKRIGRYRLLRELGRGGMGTVYLAERADGQYQQQVAIKLVSSTLGMEVSLLRFHTERQILATLEHPNIARLLDGGSTDDGLPYLVMEHIQGEPIDVFCHARHLPQTDRIRLMCMVCHAVQFAHQNLVVHRDLKPGNIMVTMCGVPKLLDFGIAKLLASEQVEYGASVTRNCAAPMTPEFAAPEQLNGTRITTATDVYALGVILYQLLTEQRPYEFTGNDIAAIVRTVCEIEPPPPSSVAPRQWQAGLRGDLDNIILRALHKEPQYRYSSARSFAEDLERYLSGLPVHASRATLRYRCGKFVKRNKLGVGLASLALAMLLTSMIVTTWQWQVAQNERERAERRYEEVRELANTIVFELSDALEKMPGSTRLRKSLLDKGLNYLDSLAQERRDEPGLLRELGTAYYRLAHIQGNPFEQNLGDTTSAMDSYQKALAILEALLARDPSNLNAVLDVTETYRYLSGMLGSLGELEQAQHFANRCVTLLEQHRGRAEGEILSRLMQCYLAAAHWNNAKGEYTNAHAVMKKAQALLATDPSLPALRIREGRVFEELAIATAGKSDFDNALRYQRRFVALAENRKKIPSRSRMLERAYRGLGQRLVAAGKLQEAEQAYHKSLQLWQARVQEHPEDVRAQRAVAGIHAELATLHEKQAEQANDPEVNQRYRQRACALFQRGQVLFRRLPDVEIGLGSRHLGLPDPAGLEQRFSSLCTA